MQPNPRPDVKTKKSGVRYVEAADILQSESGRRQILQAAEHTASIRENRSRAQVVRNAAA